jgi:4-hydroxybenzoate polyprenyltransferase
MGNFTQANKKEFMMLMTIAAILAVLWLLGLLGNIAGGLIHVLLVVAAIVFIYDVLVRRRSRV